VKENFGRKMRNEEILKRRFVRKIWEKIGNALRNFKKVKKVGNF
jgi:hypothetical protein